MKKLKIYQPCLISLILLPILVFFYVFSIIDTDYQKRVIQLNMPDIDVNNKSEYSFNLKSIRKNLKFIDSESYNSPYLLTEIEKFYTLKKDSLFLKKLPKETQIAFSIKLNKNTIYKDITDILNHFIKKNIERYYLDLERDEFVIAEMVNFDEKYTQPIDNGIYIDKGSVIMEQYSLKKELSKILNYFGFKLFWFFTFFSILAFASLKKLFFSQA